MRLPLLAIAALGIAGCRSHRPSPAPAIATAWERVGDGITCGVSALAPAGDALLLLHDNKNPGEPRLALLTLGSARAAYRPVAWRYDASLRARHASLLGAAPDSLPIDLESVAAAPGRADAFLGVTSRGTAYRFRLDARRGDAVVDAVFAPRGADSLAASANYEGFVALAGPGGAVIGVWADRGASARPGVLRWGVLDATRGLVPTTVLDSVRAPWPRADAAGEVRHLSDLAMVGDVLLASAASDAGDTGPFASSVYEVGRLTVQDGAPRLERARNVAPPQRLDGRKVEAIAVWPDRTRLVLGTDDELQGGVVLRTALASGAAATIPAAEAPDGRASNACVPTTPAPGGR